MKTFNSLYNLIINDRIISEAWDDDISVRPGYDKILSTKFPVPAKHTNRIDYWPREEVIRNAVSRLDAGVPVFIAGEPGVSKSFSIKTIAQERAAELGRQFVEWNRLPKQVRRSMIDRNNPQFDALHKKYYVYIDIRTVGMLPEDLTGLPKMGVEIETTEYAPLAWLLYTTFPNTAGIIFFDELNHGSKYVMKRLMSLFLGGEIGDCHLNESGGRWDLIAAGNVEEADANEDMEPAFKSRVAIIGMGITTNEWVEYAESVNIHPWVIAFVKSGDKRGEGGIGRVNPYLISDAGFMIGDDKKGDGGKDLTMEKGINPRDLEKFSDMLYQKEKYNQTGYYDTARKIAKMTDSNVDPMWTDIKISGNALINTEWVTQFMQFLSVRMKFSLSKLNKAVELYVNSPADYVKQYHIIPTKDAKELKTKAELAAQHITNEFFTNNGKRNLAMIYSTIDMLYDGLMTYTWPCLRSKKHTEDSKSCIKAFVGFVKLMHDAGLDELNNILISRFKITNPKDLTGRELIIGIVTSLRSGIANDVYNTVFEPIYKMANDMMHGRFGQSVARSEEFRSTEESEENEESETSNKINSLTSAELMKLKEIRNSIPNAF